MIQELRMDMHRLANSKRAEIYHRFFKTGKGEYGEGDKFLGIPVPPLRMLSLKYKHLPLNDIQQLLQSKFHEKRVLALFILAHQYKKAEDKKFYVDFYIHNTKYINNWDLVDLSAYKILGDYLLDKKDRSILYVLAKSANVWERRIAIISTFAFIQQKQFTDTVHIAESLLADAHDLIHKAVGWMLREMGKKDPIILEHFLNRHIRKMPRTMLRYAIEKFSEEKREYYLNL